MSKIIASTYEVITKLGSGGGGNVYLANHLRLGTKVVLKADKRKISVREELLRREVDVLKELKHPYIPRVYDFFTEGDTTYTVMEYIEGESLDKPLRRGEKFSQAQVIEWAIQLLDALSYLHKPIHGDPPRGYVHSDIKPANIMRMPSGNICLIDFNIALALGEKNIIGCSAGYASPEHYGLDFSFSSETGNGKYEQDEDESTLTIASEGGISSGDITTVTLSENHSQSSAKKRIVPDIRSDIYSVGATLYHLLSGRRPSKKAQEVERLSEKEFSPQVIKIIMKAMNPNPDLRYQTADEMRQDFLELRKNDPRVRRWKRKRLAACILFPAFAVAGVFIAFVGLKRMQTEESWLKLAEYSKNALEEGDTESAIEYALQAQPQDENLFIPTRTAETQKALTDAVGVYDLADGYKTYETVELPSELLYLALAPDGNTASALYDQNIVVFDTETTEMLATLSAEKSALSEIEYLNNDTIVYAGENGITAYNISKNRELWCRDPATGISVSADGSTVAAVYKNKDYANIYDTVSGDVKYNVDFSGRMQSVTVNDNFANPRDNLFEINSDGSWLGVSFEDGSLQLFNLNSPGNDIILMENGSGYTHFEGGFSGQYFAFSASNSEESVFAVIDVKNMEQTGGFQDEAPFGVQADEKGIYVQSDNILVKLDPVTGEQKPLVTMNDNITQFDVSQTHTMVTTKEQFLFFDAKANLLTEYNKKTDSNLISIAEKNALIGSVDSPTVRILKYENHPEAEIFSYEPGYEHDEARLSADGDTVMLFSYQGFRLYKREGKLISETEIPNNEEVYDQQFIREDTESYLKVIYNDGTVRKYSARDGTIMDEGKQEKPDKEMTEEFYTDQYRIESPLHGTPTVYDINTNKQVTQFEEDAYLTYVSQVGDYIIIQYVTADGYCYGQMLNGECELIAELPYLCDVIDAKLIFDYPTGNMRTSQIYGIDELIQLAQEQEKEEKV